MPRKGKLTVSDPTAAHRKTITFDRKKFIPALAKAVLTAIPVGFGVVTGLPTGSVLDSALGKMGPHLVDLVASFGLETSSEGMACRLIFTAAGKAAFELVREASLPDASDEGHTAQLAALDAMLTQADAGDLAGMLEKVLTAEPLVLDRHFFENPAKPLPLEAIAEVLGSWLGRLGLPRPQTQAIANRFERYFVYAVYDEWLSDVKNYAPVFTALETPFDAALEKTMAWERYWAHLRRQVQLPMMLEPFGLDAVYIPLRAYFVTRNCPDDSCAEASEVFRRTMDDKQSVATQHVVELERALHDWLAQNNKDDAIRLVCGGPGSGKSSFAKMFAADIAKNEQCLIFVPLAQKDPRKKLKDMIGDFLDGSGLLPFNPINAHDKPLLLILDGLDELSLQGRSGAEAAKQLLEEVRSAIGIANYEGFRLRCLITGRDLTVQAVEQVFHLADTSLHILPYCIDAEKEITNSVDPNGLIKNDQRDDWWRKYGQASGHGYNSMPEPLRHDQLREMSGQPLLNYLLALIYAREPEKLVNARRPAIYNQLLGDVYERDYKKPHLPLSDLKREQFLFVLEKIAVAIWHGDGRTASLGELKAHCGGSQAQQLLERLLAGVDQGLMRLLTAFYFRQAMQ